MIFSASSGNCVLDAKADDGDVHMNADKLLDSSTSCIGNEESSTKMRIQTRSSCLGVAYAVNHFQQRKKRIDISFR